jgi:insulysin
MFIPNIIKSKNDNRKSFTYELNNKLRVYIINDKDADSACAAMLVKIGYFQDTIPGIAHFLEHMLFNGTKNYPDEKMFSSYISQYNGIQNAYTTHDHTCYFFSVSQEGLNTGLEMFGDFFIAPLLNKDAVNREKEAVHSEHIKNINDDGWRAHEIIKVASHENHWFSKFGTGSNKSLSVPDIHIKVRDFFETYYSSDIMTLVIITKDTIESVIPIIDKIYSQIKIKKIKQSNLIQNGDILKKNILIKYVPIENNNQIILNWEMTYFRDTPHQSPFEFLYYLISNEQKNSIHYILSQKEYIVDFSCHIRDIIFSKCIFCIDIQLTDKGFSNKNEIISLIINYIDLLKKNINTDHFKNLYTDHLKLSLYKFNFFEKTGSVDSILSICSLLNNYNIDPRCIFVTDIMQEYYSENIKENIKIILDELNLDNLLVISGSQKYKKKYEGKFNIFENYGTEYIIENINYKNIYKKIKINVSVPIINHNISISTKINHADNKIPILVKNDNFDLYWMHNTKFNTPDICIISKIDIKKAIENVYSDTCVRLYIDTFLADINHDLYMARRAYYGVGIGYTMGKLIFKIDGNYENIVNICKKTLDSLLNDNLLSDHNFETSKYNLIKNDENSIFASSYSKVKKNFNKQLLNYYYTAEDRLKIKDKIKNITKSDIINEFKNIINNNNTTTLITGNCPENIMIDIKSCFNNIVKNKYNVDLDLVRKLKKNIKYTIQNDNKLEENNACGIYIYLGQIIMKNNIKWIKNYCIMNLIHNIISVDYFDELRTKEMFGYIVSGNIVDIGDISKRDFYYSFTVQSHEKSSNEITTRTEKFINDFYTKIKNLSLNEFEILVNSFIDGLKNDFNNLLELTYFLFINEIESGYLKFDYKNKMIEEYKKINISDIIDFYKDKFIVNKKSLIIEINKQK